MVQRLEAREFAPLWRGRLARGSSAPPILATSHSPLATLFSVLPFLVTCHSSLVTAFLATSHLLALSEAEGPLATCFSEAPLA